MRVRYGAKAHKIKQLSKEYGVEAHKRITLKRIWKRDQKGFNDTNGEYEWLIMKALYSL